jgi:hypothetical protein
MVAGSYYLSVSSSVRLYQTLSKSTDLVTTHSMASSYGVRKEFVSPPYAVTEQDSVTSDQPRPDTIHTSTYSTTLIVLYIITPDIALNVIVHERS